ncbi:hypothetical protein Esti_000959 [Eimeria stiedai]
MESGRRATTPEPQASCAPAKVAHAAGAGGGLSSSFQPQAHAAAANQWPFISSHYREWLFSAAELEERRAAVHARALKELEAANPAAAAAAPGPHDLLQLQQYFALQLLLIYQKKGLKPYALEAACLFFHRFFLSSSPLQVDVRLALFSCLLLALKAIDVARHYTLGELLGDVENLDLEAVVSLELPVCEGLAFQLLTLHTREPLNELISVLVDFLENKYQLQQQQLKTQLPQTQQHQQEQQQEQDVTSTNNNNSTDNSTNKSTNNSSTSSRSVVVGSLESLRASHISLLQQLVRLQEDAEDLCLLMHASPTLPLRYTPSQLALGGLLSSTVRRELLQQGLDVEALLKQHLLALNSPRTTTPAAAAAGATPAAAAEGTPAAAEGTPAAAAGATPAAAAATPAAGAAAGAAAKAAAGAAQAAEGEGGWLLLQKCVEEMVGEVRKIKALQKEMQRNDFAKHMSDLLERTIDAAEVLESHAKGEDSRRERKKRKKQKRSKKEAARVPEEPPPPDALPPS